MSRATRSYHNRSMGFWLHIGLMTALFAVATLFPEFAVGQDNGNKFLPPDQLAGDLDEAGKGWWNTIAIPGFWVALIGAVVLYVTNYTQYMRVAIVAMLLFAWGDDIGRMVLTMGGVDIGG